MPVIARISGLVIDCPDPQALAPFYETLLGTRRGQDTADWVTLISEDGGPTLSLQRVGTFRSPGWPCGDPPQQLHVDFLVEDLDVAEQRVLALGGRTLEGSDKPIGYRVYADPIGHPFCLVTPEGLG